MNAKTIVSGIFGGIVSFFLGWIIYGMLLMPTMAAHSNPCIMRPEAEMIWWALIASNLFNGITIALVLSWSNVSNLMDGLNKSAIFGFVLMLAWNLSLYSVSTWYTDLTGVFLDIAVGTFMTTVIGGAIGWMLGRGNAVSN